MINTGTYTMDSWVASRPGLTAVVSQTGEQFGISFSEPVARAGRGSAAPTSMATTSEFAQQMADIAPLVKRVTIQAFMDMTMTELRQIIGQLPFVTELEMHYRGYWDKNRWGEYFSSQAHSLTSLMLYAVDFTSFPALTHFITSFPNLRHLELQSCKWPGIEGNDNRTFGIGDFCMFSDGDGLRDGMDYAGQLQQCADSSTVNLKSLVLKFEHARASSVVTNWLLRREAVMELQKIDLFAKWGPQQTENAFPRLIARSSASLQDLRLHLIVTHTNNCDACLGSLDSLLSRKEFRGLKKVALVVDVVAKASEPMHIDPMEQMVRMCAGRVKLDVKINIQEDRECTRPPFSFGSISFAPVPQEEQLLWEALLPV